jgi:ornithine--oxo-acid transaminase
MRARKANEATMSNSEHFIEREASTCARNYDPLPVVAERAAGCTIWDADGKQYLDMMSGYSAVSFGHAHPRLTRVLCEQAQRLAVTSRAIHSDQLAPFAEALTMLVGLPRVLPMNTGVEAVETAIKAARKWATVVKGVPDGRARIIVCSGNFHGRTTTVVGFSSHAQYRFGFGPFDGSFVPVPFGDAAALEAAIDSRTAAFLFEPIQCEGGFNVPPAGWLKAVREICSRHRVLMIADEVQTGLGRTGAVLACDHEQVRPDGLCLGKALGGGLLPISAFLATEELMGVFQPGDHGSTFGGNALAARVAREALAVLVDERLPERADALGEHARAKLRLGRHAGIVEVRGRGLLTGVELRRDLDASAVVRALVRRGVITKDTHRNTVRLTPPLVIEFAELDFAIDALFGVLDDALRNIPQPRRAA